MPNIVTTVLFERETSGTHFFKEVDDDNPSIRSLYITKAALRKAGFLKTQGFRITIEPLPEEIEKALR